VSNIKSLIRDGQQRGVNEVAFETAPQWIKTLGLAIEGPMLQPQTTERIFCGGVLHTA